MIDGGVHWLCWMDTEECLCCRREQYKLRRDRETPEEAEWRRPRNWECLRHQRAAIPVEQRRFVIRNLKVSTLTWDLVCIIAHSLTWTHIYHDKHHWSITWDHFLRFQQQQRGSAHWHALSLIDHGDASDSEDIHRWMGLEKHVGGWWPGWRWILHCTNDYYTCEVHHCYNCKYYCFTLVISYMPICTI